MKIREVTAGIKLSEDYNSYQLSITAELDQEDETPEIIGLQLMGKAMDIVQKKTGIVPGETNTEKKTTTKTKVKKPSVPVVDVCEKCGAEITQKVLDYSQEHYNKKLCFECQKLEKKD